MIGKFAVQSFLAATLWCSLPANLRAGPPTAGELEAAIQSGDFTNYQTSATAWLNEQAAGRTDAAALAALLKDPDFVTILARRQFIAKTGADKLGAFAKADPANGAFLGWLLKNSKALNLYLEAVVPVSLAARERNDYKLSTGALEIWKKIIAADPDAKDGLYLKLAIATAIRPPGTGNHGAGQSVPPAEPVGRYLHFKKAHQNQELFPSFNNLTVWEYQHIVSSCASDSDLAWAREAINTWRPDLRADELVVNSTSEVWRRNSPHLYDASFKKVLSGGGKCGPRSSWSVMVCQAFGIPAIGVGQPAHACVAYKAVNPMTQPQPGSAWKVGYGRGWHVSKLEGMSGPDFLAGIEERSRTVEFAQVEHLRAFASALVSKEQAAAVMKVAHQIQKSVPTVKTDLTASAKADEAEKELTPARPAPAKANSSKEPVKLAAGATRIEAAAFSRMSGVRVYDSHGGGRQVNFEKNLPSSWLEYTLDVPAAGNYLIELKAATPNDEQVFNVSVGSGQPAEMKIPNTSGLWGQTPPVEVRLEQGRQTLKIAAPLQRGVAVRHVELKARN